MTRWRIQFVPSMEPVMGGAWCLLTPRRFTAGYFSSIGEAVDWLVSNWNEIGWMDAP